MVLTPRWTKLRPHLLQSAYWRSPKRFNMLPCGRRSGKTELFKRKVIKKAVRGTKFYPSRFFAAAPTNDQAVKIYWQDLKSLSPPDKVVDISESHHRITYISGGEIYVLGMDKPERIEGQPWDGGGMDEYGNMKEKAWTAHVRPALSDRLGWCDFLGVPEGMNHYYDLYEKAKADPTWGVYEWASADILPPEEIEAAKRDLHPLMFEQEYGGKFVNFNGVAIFDLEKLLENGKPVTFPAQCDSVYAVIDTAVKDGKEHDGTAVIYFAKNQFAGVPLTILDWDVVQIQGALLDTWLKTVFQRLEDLARICRARQGSLGAWIEDKQTGSVLIQQAKLRDWPARELPSILTAMGKDERALSVSGHHYAGKCKISDEAYNKTVVFKGQMKNHLITQVTNFRIGDPDAGKRADDLLDDYCYGLAITFGDSDGL